MGGADSSPESHMTEEEKLNREFVERVYEQIFYCENCGYYWEEDRRHDNVDHGTICEDCLKELGCDRNE